MFCDALASPLVMRRGMSILALLLTPLSRSIDDPKDPALSCPKAFLSLLACRSLDIIGRVGFFGTGGAVLRATLDDMDCVNVKLYFSELGSSAWVCSHFDSQSAIDGDNGLPSKADVALYEPPLVVLIACAPSVGRAVGVSCQSSSAVGVNGFEGRFALRNDASLGSLMSDLAGRPNLGQYVRHSQVLNHLERHSKNSYHCLTTTYADPNLQEEVRELSSHNQRGPRHQDRCA